MRLPRRHFLQLAGAAGTAPAFAQLASALDYPTHAVRIVVGFPPGGPTDIYARLIGEWLSSRLGQTFVIENRPGAGSTIGVEAVLASPADGYTLLLVSTSATIAASYYRNLSFDLIRDIEPVCGISLEPMVIVVNPSLPIKTVPQLIDYAKDEPGRLVMASVGNGTTPHLAGELFMMMAGVKFLHVPYHGAAPALTDLLGGRADIMFEAMTDLVSYINAGKVRALAVTTAKRSPVFPDLPTVGECVSGYEASVWFGIGARKQTPAEIVQELNREINAGLKDPKLRARVSEGGGLPLTGTTADFEKLFVDDATKWAKVMREADIKPE
jgi:tripartite-type tricarboxylate transporter receptor subunit TctC